MSISSRSGARVLQRLLILKYFNPPEAIPLSDRPGHFFSIRFLTQSASGHTMVSQTDFFHFFKTIFDQDVSCHTMVCQTRFFLKDILDCDVNDHTTVSQTGSVVWTLTSQVKKVF